MTWQVVYTKSALKDLRRMGNDGTRHVVDWFSETLEGSTDPRVHRGVLKGKLKGEWRYKHDGWRALAVLNDHDETITLFHIGWRQNFYDSKR